MLRWRFTRSLACTSAAFVHHCVYNIFHLWPIRFALHGCCASCILWGVWLAANSYVFVEREPVAILEQLHAVVHRYMEEELEIRCDCRNNRNLVFRQFTQMGDKVRLQAVPRGTRLL